MTIAPDSEVCVNIYFFLSTAACMKTHSEHVKVATSVKEQLSGVYAGNQKAEEILRSST